MATERATRKKRRAPAKKKKSAQKIDGQPPRTGKRGGGGASAARTAGTRSAGPRAPFQTGETTAQRRRRAGKILAKLKRTYGPVTCALKHESALELLVATILSAQSTDATVNRITPQLFASYRTPADYAAAETQGLEQAIHSTGFFRQKARSIQGACRLIVERFGGQVPDSMEELLALPGVARKTANVVLGTWFGENAGVVVDTHVGRLAGRMGLTWRARNGKDAVRIEADLMELLPRQGWTYFSHAMIRHGRLTCTAVSPGCASCPLAGLCPSAGTFD